MKRTLYGLIKQRFTNEEFPGKDYQAISRERFSILKKKEHRFSRRKVKQSLMKNLRKGDYDGLVQESE